MEAIRLVLDRKSKEKAEEKKRHIRVCKSKCTLHEENKKC